MNIRMKMKDGTMLEFLHQGRPGGSYTKSLRYEPGFAVITDEWYKETAIPSDLIAVLTTWPNR
jgi:hypothetical protein